MTSLEAVGNMEQDSIAALNNGVLATSVHVSKYTILNIFLFFLHTHVHVRQWWEVRLMSNCPLQSTNNFFYYKKGILRDTLCDPIRLNHAVTAVAYTAQWYLIKNR